jgi:hypothetical protein
MLPNEERQLIMETTARPQSGGGFFFVIVVVVMLGIMGWVAYRQEQDRAIGIEKWTAQQTAQAIAQPTPQPARPTTPPAAPQAPVIVQTVPEGAAPQFVAPQPAQAAPVGEAAQAPRPLIIIHHQSSDGHQTITGSGACAVGGSVARRCGK